jgi:hypothetical protein
MATSVKKEGPTPHGGVMAEFIFSNADGEIVDQQNAKNVEVIEYDAEGKVLHRTYATVGGGE